jgi:hypothetical protein
MTHFLWVEDFNISETKRSENIVSSTVSSVFGSILDNTELSARLAEEDENDAQDFLEEKGIFLKLNLLEALEFINDPKELSKIDFVVLDVDMPLENGQRDNNNYLPILIEQYQSEDALRKIAGYHIYTELVIELGFPKSHILFCSNHASYFEELKSKFASANIKPPVSPNPNEPFLRKEDKEFINQWLDAAHLDYFVLRRGIIEACQYLKTLPKEKLRFAKFCKEGKNAFLDIDDYLATLENFLPLREPADKKTLYKLFIRTLAHEWEESVEPKPLDDKGSFAFSWVMKMTRNWIAHNSTAIFTNLTEQDIAYLFICNMRALFDLEDAVQPYEKQLFSLFNIKADTENKIRNKDIPLIDTYVSYFNEKTNRTDVHNILNDLQNDKYKLQNKGDEFFITGLYHCFWFLTSSHDNRKDRARPNDKNPNQVFVSRHYTFEFFNYTKTDFLFELARRIYSRSFS